MSNSYDTIVIGAGQAGLASAYSLQRAGSRFLVLGGGSRIGESWLRRWDSLRLFTRTTMLLMLDDKWPDVTYYRGKACFESDYFYPVRLNPLKKAAGKVFDYVAARSVKK